MRRIELRSLEAKRFGKRRALVRAQRAPRHVLEHANASQQICSTIPGEAGRSNAIRHERLIDASSAGAGKDQPDPALPVIGDAKRLVESAAGEERRPSNRRPASDEACAENSQSLIVGDKRGLVAEQGALLAVDLEERIGCDEIEIGPRRREVSERLESARLIRVVSIEDHDEVAGRCAHARIQRRRSAAVLLPEQHDLTAPGLEHPLERIRRSVIADDHFQRALRLRRHRSKRRTDSLSRLVRRDHDGERGRRSGRDVALGFGGEEHRHSVPALRLAVPPAGDHVQPVARPTFSVLVAVHNAAGVVGDALASALAQTVRPLEVIVCDDGSTDDFTGALKPYAEHVVVVRQSQRGEAAAKNAAARAATGDFVAILDADDVYLPRRIEALGDLASLRPDLDILTTDAYLEVSGRVVRRCYDDTWRFEVVDQRRAILDRNFVFGLAAVRRTRLLEAGGFDESLRWATDWDCWLRLIMDGARVGLVDEPLARYRLSKTSLTAQRTQLYRGRVTVLEKATRSAQLSAAERAVATAALARERGHAAAARPWMRCAHAHLTPGGSPSTRRAHHISVSRAGSDSWWRRLLRRPPAGGSTPSRERAQPGVVLPGEEEASAPRQPGAAPR